MFEPNSFVSKAARSLFDSPGDPSSQEPKQRRLMAMALSLLVVALVFVLYHDRDFWFPDGQEAEDRLEQGAAAAPAVAQGPQSQAEQTLRKKSRSGKPQLTEAAQPATAPPIVATATRTVLPPLEVEVVAGDSHRMMQPATNAVQLDVQPNSAEEAPENSPVLADSGPATVGDSAAEHVEMSADTSQVVTEPVKPGYPLLARQMKVQGSVILLAMISRDGKIQQLRVLSGPPILAGAAREAVKQWHFKPHYEGADPVETVAKVTVNFTISTN